MHISDKDTIHLIVEGLEEKKGRDITLIDLRSIEDAPVSYFVIASGTSNTHVSAVADGMIEFLAKQGIKPYATDGTRNCEWIVVDYGDTLVHVFTPETRQHYNLEELWSDAEIKQISTD